MRSRLFYPFIKHKSGSKLEDKLPISSPCIRCGAWSYSYDLKLNQICEEALQKATKCDYSESEDEDRFNEDLEDDIIFQGNAQIHEPAAIDHLRESVTEAFSYDLLENTQKQRPYKLGDSLDLATVNETEQDVDNVKCLLLSDVQKQKSFLERIIRLFPKEMGNSDETKRTNKEKIGPQIQTNIMDKLQQFIQKTVLPSFEQLQVEYNKEKTKWKKQVDFLKHRNSLLKSELQDVKRAYRKAAEQLTNLKKTFCCQNNSVFGRNFDMDVDPQMKPVESKKTT